MVVILATAQMKAHWFWCQVHNLKVAFTRPPYTRGFEVPSELTDHFDRHQSKLLLVTTEAEYAQAADRFCGGKIAKETLLCFRSRDGARVMYNTISHEFAFVLASGYIGSYYIISKPRKGLPYMQRKCAE